MHTEVIVAAVAAILPTLTVLVGILLGRDDYNKLDACISGIEARLDARMTAMKNRFHADMLLVIGKLTELEVRVARLEEKVTR